MKLMKKIAITYGDEQGIGLEIIQKIINKNILQSLASKYNCEYILYGNTQDLIFAQKTQEYLKIKNIEINKFQDYSYTCVKKAVEDCLEYKYNSLVTGPVNKAKWQEYNHNYSGQTELLSELTGCQAEMLFWANKTPDNKPKDWHILLLTRHIALKDVTNKLNYQRLEQAVNTANNYFNNKNIKTNIALAGINPHGGDNGLIGTEEKYIWANWIEKLNISKIYSPDEIWFTSARDYLNNNTQKYNLYLAPYHDQVLPLIKTITNLEAVNISIGLPFLRTSPDHGTAYSLVNTGQANIQPFINAIEYASR